MEDTPQRPRTYQAYERLLRHSLPHLGITGTEHDTHEPSRTDSYRNAWPKSQARVLSGPTYT